MNISHRMLAVAFLVAVTVPPRFAAPGDRLWLGLDPLRLHLIETGTDRIHRAGEGP